MGFSRQEYLNGVPLPSPILWLPDVNDSLFSESCQKVTDIPKYIVTFLAVSEELKEDSSDQPKDKPGKLIIL